MENVKAAAKKIQKMGTGGDTILAHINPREAELLKMMGGTGAINPDTGLPEFKKFWKRITAKKIVAAAPIIIAVAAPGIGSAIGTAVAGAVGATVTAAEAAAIGSAVMGGTVAAARGGNVEDVLKAAAASGIASAASSAVGSALPTGTSQTVSGTLGGAASGATQAALTGGDIGKGATTGAILGGTTGAYRDITTPSPTYGTTSAYDQYASNIDPLLREGMTREEIMQGAIQSPYYRQAQSNIDPGQLEGMSAEQVAAMPAITTTTPGVVESPRLREAGETATRIATSYLLTPKPSYGGYTPITSTPVGIGTTEAGTPAGTTPGSAALAQALRIGEPIDVATGKGARRPVWNIASLRTKDETGS